MAFKFYEMDPCKQVLSFSFRPIIFLQTGHVTWTPTETFINDVMQVEEGGSWLCDTRARIIVHRSLTKGRGGLKSSNLRDVIYEWSLCSGIGLKYKNATGTVSPCRSRTRGESEAVEIRGTNIFCFVQWVSEIFYSCMKRKKREKCKLDLPVCPD